MDRRLQRDFVDYHSGEMHTVHKSKHRLARCRFVMIYSDPDNAPLPSKGLPLARIPALDPEDGPVYGLTEDSWKLEIACHQCQQLVLNNDRVGGPIKLREARRRRAERVKNGDQAPQLLCGDCDPDVVLKATTSTSVGRKRAHGSLPPVDMGAGAGQHRVQVDPQPWEAPTADSQTHRAAQRMRVDLSEAGCRAQLTLPNALSAQPYLLEPTSTQKLSLAAGSTQRPPSPYTPPASAQMLTPDDGVCPFCVRNLQQGQRFGCFWRKYGYQGTRLGLAMPSPSCTGTICCCEVVNNYRLSCL